MNILKYIIYGLLALVSIYLVLCLVGPKDFNTVRETTIKAPATFVYDQVANVKFWKNWSAWNIRDKEMEITWDATTEGLDAGYAWKSKSQGNGKLAIVEAVNGKKIKTKLNFTDWEGDNFATHTFTQQADGTTKVSWNMEGGNLPFFIRGLMLVMGMKKGLEKDYDEGLKNLKDYCEKESVKTNGITVMETDFPATTFLAQRETVGFENISAFFQKYLPEIYGFASTTTNKPIGMPYGLFYVYDEPAKKTDMAAAVSIPSNLVFDKNPYQVIQIPASKCVVASFYGSYEQTGKAHEALDKYMNERNLTFVAPAMEQYISDPTEAKDASEILTKVIYLYK